MFEARLAQCSLLKKLVEAVRDLLDHANFDCNEEGISVQALDTTQISLVSILLRSEAFEVYRCDRTVSLGVNVVHLSKILKCAGNDDKVTIRAEDEGAEAAEFLFESVKQDRTSDFKLKLTDIDVEHLGIPDDDFDTSVTMPAAEYRRIVNDLQVLGDTVSISVTKDGAMFSVDGDIGKGSICLHPSSAVDDPKSAVSIEMTEPVEMSFSLRYLNFFAKAAPLSATVTLSMSVGKPLSIEFPMDNDAGFLRFFLAPKLDDEEETPADSNNMDTAESVKQEDD